MGYDQILLEIEWVSTGKRQWEDATYLDIHHVIDANASKFWKLLPAFLQESANRVTLLALYP